MEGDTFDVDPNQDPEMALKMKEKLGARLDARKEEREQIVQQMKEDKECIEEQVKAFNSKLEPLVVDLESLLLNTKPETLDSTALKLGELQKFVTDAGYYLPAYELRKSQGIVAELNSKFQGVRETTKPKKKFGFKSSKTKVPSNPIQSTEKPSVAGAGDSVPPTLISGDNSFVLRQKQGENFTLESDQVDGKDVDLADLSDCVVKLEGKPSTLHLSNIRSCEIHTGNVATSVMLDLMSSSTVLCSCQQMRMHRSTATDVYLFTSSRAIIEDSNGIRFAPLPPLEGNNWDQVGDFNWLAQDKQSPNWSIIPLDERKHY